MQLEKLAGELLGKSRSYANRERRGSEWYETTVGDVHRIFNEVHKNFRSGQYDLTKAPIFQFDDNYINISRVAPELKKSLIYREFGHNGSNIKENNIGDSMN